MNKKKLISAIKAKAVREGISLQSLGIYEDPDFVEIALRFLLVNLEDVEPDDLEDIDIEDYSEDIVYEAEEDDYENSSEPFVVLGNEKIPAKYIKQTFEESNFE